MTNPIPDLTEVRIATAQKTINIMPILVIALLCFGFGSTWSMPEPERKDKSVVEPATQSLLVQAIEAPVVTPSMPEIVEVQNEIKPSDSEIPNKSDIVENAPIDKPIIAKIENTNRDRLIAFVNTKNKSINAVEFVDACLSTKLNCSLAIAMTGQESSFCNRYTLSKNGSWKTYSFDQVKDVKNNLTGGLISYNCSGVKTRNGTGGNFQTMSDGYKGSIIGYSSWVDYFQHKEQIASRRYLAMLKATVSLADIQGISDRYVGGAGINIGWSANVFSILKSI